MQFFFQMPQNLVYMVKILSLNKLRYINNARATHSGVSRGKTVVLATATGNHLPIAESQTRFCRHYRAENLCYLFGHGQKLLPQFRKIVGLVLSIGWDTHPRTKAYSERTYKRYVQLKRRNWSRKTATVSSVGLDDCTRMRGVLLRSCHAGEVA